MILRTRRVAEALAYRKNITPYRSLYFELLNGEHGSPSINVVAFLQQQLEHANTRACDLPRDVAQLQQWAEHNVIETGLAYKEYREARKNGAPRRYFSNKSHALFFLNAVAPAKLVDGSWLYGMLSRWQDPRFEGLIRTYLEELGDGVADKNHVALYKKLLATHHCEAWDQLDDRYYLQGAIQLALGHLTFGKSSDRFLPEAIGFNLGYEQLPLHLLITAYELKELGIDPYYFTLHITIDNLDSGHAKKSLESVVALIPKGIAGNEFYRRLINGYQLNTLGESTCAIIESFDLRAEVIKIFQRKAVIGQFMHSDRCKIAGRTINDWLSSAHGAGDLLQSLESAGWIKRHQDPRDSKFWRLIQGDQPLMFGVFSPYEQQLIFDWIAGDYQPQNQSISNPRWESKLKQDSVRSLGDGRHIASLSAHRGKAKTTQFRSLHNHDEPLELRDFNEQLVASTDPQTVMHNLINSMSPDQHWTPIGLQATRLFKNLYDTLN